MEKSEPFDADQISTTSSLHRAISVQTAQDLNACIEEGLCCVMWFVLVTVM